MLGHFVVADHICCESNDFTKLNFKDLKVQRPDSELMVGRDAKRYLQHLQKLGEADPTSLKDLEEDYDPDACKKFYRCV